MYEHVKTGCKHIQRSEQPLQFQSGCYLNKPRVVLPDCLYKELNFVFHNLEGKYKDINVLLVYEEKWR